MPRRIGDPRLIMPDEHNRGPSQKFFPIEPVEPDLPVLNAEDLGDPYRATPKSNISDLFAVYDYAIQAPIRAGVSEYTKSAKEGDFFPELRGFWGAAKQYFKKPETAPTWSETSELQGLSPLTFKEAAMQAGLQGMYPDISPADIDGFVGESILDPLNLFGAGAGKKVVAGAGLMAGKKAKGFSRAKAKMSALWDKKQRFEIDDSMMRVKAYNFPQGEDYEMLSEVIDHPELFKNYPELKKVSVSFDGKGSSAAFHEAGDGHITMGADLRHSQKAPQTLIHEIQHYIQKKEGFAPGGSPDVYGMEQDYLAKIFGDREIAASAGDARFELRAANKARAVVDSGDKKALRNLGFTETQYADLYIDNPKEFTKKVAKVQKENNKYNSMISNPNEQLKKYDEIAGESNFERYQRLAGEAESRDSEARMLLTPEQRLSQQPLESTGLQVDDLIVRGEGGQSMSVGDDALNAGKDAFYHVSPEPITKIHDKGQFGDVLFFSTDDYYPMSNSKTNTKYKMFLKDDEKMIDASQLFYDENASKIEHIKTEVMERYGVDADDAEELISGNTSIRDVESNIDPEDWEGLSNADWDMQQQAARASNELGYRGVYLEDEQGTVAAFPMKGREKDLIMDSQQPPGPQMSIDKPPEGIRGYHGTDKVFEDFRKNTQRQAGGGFFFTNNPEQASHFAGVQKGYNAPNVKPVDLYMKKPKKVDFKGERYSPSKFKEIIEEAKTSGYDGIVIDNVKDRGGVSTQYIVFEPSQIKSAFD